MSLFKNRLAAAGVIVAAFAGGTFGQWLLDATPALAQAAGAPAVVRAEAFVLVDAEGKEWARLEAAGGLAGLTVLDEEGRPGLRVGRLEEPAGFGLRAYDAEGANRATFAYWADGIGGMRVYDAEGVKRVGLGLGDSGCGLSMQNAEAATVVGVGVGPGAGGGDFVLLRPFDGEEVWRASKAAQGAYVEPPADWPIE